MKKNHVIILSAFAVVATLFSCQKETSNENAIEKAPENSSAIMTVNAGPIQTKTYLEASGSNYNVFWSAGDQIAAFEAGSTAIAETKTVSTALDASSASASFTMDFSGNSLSPNYSYVFVYPANSLKKYNDIYETYLPYQQTFTATSFDKNADVLISEGVTDQASRPASVDVAFERIGATALMNIKAPTTDETISKIVFSTTEGNIAGYIQLDPAAGTHTKTIMEGGNKTFIELTPASSTTFTGTIPVWFRLAAITLVDNFTVEVTTNENTYYKRVDLASASKTLVFEDSGLTKFNVNMATASKAIKFNVGTEITSVFPSTKNGIKVKYDKGSGSLVTYASPFKFNQNNTITISGGTAKIKQVAFDLKSDKKGTIAGDTGTYDDGVWTAEDENTSTVVFTNSGNQALFYSITVVYSGTGSETIEAGSPNITFTAAEASIEAGNTTTTTLTTNHPGVKSYQSSDETVATVDGNGVITGHAAGTARITANVAAYNTTYTSVAAISRYVDITVTAASGNVTVTWTPTSGSLGTAIASAGSTASGTIATAAGGGTPSYNWSYTRTLVSLKDGKADYVGYTAPNIQLGSGNALEQIVFTTNTIPGTIKTITVNCRGDKHKISATVNGTSYIPETNMTDSQDPYSNAVEGSSSGEIVISILPQGSTKKAFYIQSITVVYTPTS